MALISLQEISLAFGGPLIFDHLSLHVEQGDRVALLGRNHPVGVILASLLFGALLRGGLFVDIFTEHVSKDLVMVLQGIIILFVASEALFRGLSRRRIKGV